ncbi:hypothetical protein SBI_04104 [Streptomyces bingchenggensis BCW-1]|uniref:Uncharacterized protein n=1 Tax=Streptomyces bingchenggensis (strain BCW-1) TaxID=749414 RepID=D7BQJ6_STRBB|nr:MULTISPECIES: hypothetical protein [Streptomyces]ADI07225.1 hypothetical protein SBI_04104 [Streptomyces bingchenggensis BCW-1]
MGQGRILNRGARTFGALVCAVLGLISLAWIVRDFDKADESSHVWWTWAGIPYRLPDSIFGTSLADPVLLAVYVAAGIAALRSSAAAGALASAAVATVALRLPSLWNLHADWMQGIPDGLKTRAQLSAWTAVVLGGLLLAVVAVGRRPADGTAPDYAVAPADSPPGRPRPAVAVTAALFLGAVAVVEGAWQIYWAHERGWDIYEHQLTGKYMLTTLLSPPGAWAAWTVIALALTAAFAALGRAPLARPLGMTAAALVLGDGITAISAYIKFDYLEHLDDLPTVGVLSVLSGFFEGIVGLVALIVLAQPADPADGVPLAGWGGPAAQPYGGHGGYGGYGVAGGGYGGAASGGYGATDGGYGPADGGYGYTPPPPTPPTAPPGPPPVTPPAAPPPPSSPPPPPPPGW